MAPRPSKRSPVPLILSSFPAPPSHIPPTPSSAGSNPPPTGPPTLPLPPLPSGPSRISEHEQLLILSSVARKSSKYSQRDRDSITNDSPNRDSVSSLGHPSLSVSVSKSNSMTAPVQQLTRTSTSSIPLSDSESEPSPALSSDYPRIHRRHQPHESISSIDMRDVLGVYGDDVEYDPRQIPRSSRPRLQSKPGHSQQESIADPIDPEMILEVEAIPPPASTTQSPASALSPSLSPSRHSPYTLTESYRLGHARSTSSATAVSSAGSQSQTPIQTPIQSHTRSISNSSITSTPQTVSSLSPSSVSTYSKVTDSYSTTTELSTTSSCPLPSEATITTIKKFHLEMGDERSRSEAHKRAFVSQGGCEGYAGESEEGGGGERTEDETDSDNRAVIPRQHHHSLSQVGLGGIMVTKTTTTISSAPATINNKTIPGQIRNDEMTLEELTTIPAQPQQSPTSIRVPSPDIATILSVTPRPALSLSRCRSGAKSKSKSAGNRRVVSANTSVYPDGNACPLSTNRNRRQSEGASTILAHGKTPSSELAYLHKDTDTNASTDNSKSSLSWSMSAAAAITTYASGYYEQEAEDYDEALERVLEGKGSEDEDDMAVGTTWDDASKDKRRGRISGKEEKKGGDGSDSDSSLDLHTPLPHLMLRHGLLSPNSKLLPQADCSRAATPSDGRPDSIMSVVSNGSVMTKSGIMKDERDTVTRRVRHRDGRLLRGGIGLTTGLGWSDSEDEDAPSPLTRRLSSLNLSRRSSASSIRSANLPPFRSPSLSTSLSSSSLRRLHPLSRSYSSGAILDTEPEHDKTFDSYSYDDEEGEEEEDHTLEESGQWAQRHRLGVSSPRTLSTWTPVSWSRHQPRNRRNHHHQTPLGTRTSTSSVGSTFSLEVTIPEGGEGQQRSKTPSRLRRPSSIKSMANGAGGRDSSGSSLDNRSSGLSSTFSLSNQRRSGGDDNNNSGNTPSSTASTPSIPMPTTPKDIFDPSAPPLLSSTRGMLGNKDKSLPPLPSGGLKKKPSGILQKSAASNGTSTALNGTGKYAFPSSTRARTLPSTSNSTPSPNMNFSAPTTTIPAIGSSLISPSSSAATIKPQVRPLQLPRHTTSRIAGDRPAVPVPSPILNSHSHSPTLPPPSLFTSVRAPTISTSTLRSPISPISPIASSRVISTTSAPTSPAVDSFGSVVPSLSNSTHSATGITRPKPRTGTGMAYRTSSYGSGGGVNSSRMRAPMMLSATLPVVSGGSGNGGDGGDGGGSIERSSGLPRAIAL